MIDQQPRLIAKEHAEYTTAQPDIERAICVESSVTPALRIGFPHRRTCNGKIGSTTGSREQRGRYGQVRQKSGPYRLADH